LLATRGRHLRRREAQSGAESIAPVTSGMARRKGKSVPLEELTPGLRVDAGRTQAECGVSKFGAHPEKSPICRPDASCGT
jgi:hypothetical protein